MREFLKGLDLLDNETIDAIMAEHGKRLTGLKEQVEDLKTKNTQYETKITELNSVIETKDNSLKDLQNVTDENKSLRAQVQMSGSNVKKEFEKFVTSEVMGKVNDKTDFATALESYKKDNPQYFGDVVVKKIQSSPNLNSGNPQPQTTNNIMNDILRSAVKNNE